MTVRSLNTNRLTDNKFINSRHNLPLVRFIITVLVLRVCLEETYFSFKKLSISSTQFKQIINP